MKKKKSAESRPIAMTNALSQADRSRRREYRKKRKLRAFIIIFISVMLCLIAAVCVFGFMGSSVIRTLTIEAGDDMVPPSAFFEEEVRAFYVGDSDVDTSVPGDYDLTVRNGVMLYSVNLTVKDTVAPAAKIKHIRIVQGKKTVTAMDFLKSIQDETEVTASFERPIDYNLLGDSDVVIILRDLGGNETRLDTKITIYPEELIPSVSIEAGHEDLSVSDFLVRGTAPGEDDAVLTQLDKAFFHKVGSQKIEIRHNGVTYTVNLTVEDTVPPAGYIINRSTYKGTPLPAENFVDRFYDETQVSVVYAEEPDFDTVGAHVTQIILEDGGKNTRTYRVTLTVRADTTKPVIEAEDRTVYIGDNIRFSEGVTATDNCDGEIEVTVDIGDFDKTTPGIYPVTFTAADSSGNTAKKTVEFTLKNKHAYQYTQDVIDALFSSTYSKIVTPSMTQKEKMRAIYDYIRENISYNGTSEKSDWEQEAYRGLRARQGDSFTFYAISRKLLTMAGIENKEVQRIKSDSSHYWNMVNFEGTWYHFDTCPHYKDYPIDSFMLTDKQAADYSKKTNGYYTYK